MSALPSPVIASQEYLRRERTALFRSEYHSGVIVAMAGGSRDHCRIKDNVCRELANQLADRPCNTYTSDLRVSVRGGKSYFYPDVVVTCGEEVFEDDQLDTLVNPIVTIEVLSPSTEFYDRGPKFTDYQLIPSLQEYVLITQSPRRFEIFRRQTDGSWRYQSWAFSPPPLMLESINCTLDPADVYFKVENDSGEEPHGDESASV